MHPLPFVWPYAAVFWAVFIWAFWPEFAVIQKAPATQADAGSVRVILIVNQLAMFLGFVARAR